MTGHPGGAATPVPGSRRPDLICVIGEVVADAVVGADPADPGIAAPGELAPAADPESGEIAAPGRPGPEAMHLTVHAGGGPANTAVALARLGTPVRFAGRFSTGTLGRLGRRRLEQAGVDLTAAIDVPEPATLAITALDPQGGADYEFYTDGTADWGWDRAELDEVVRIAPPPTAIHTGSLALALRPPGDVIEEVLAAARAHATISIDPNVRTPLVPVDTYRAAIDRWAALADLIRLSDDDAAQIWPGARPAEVADLLHHRGTAVVVITAGSGDTLASVAGDGTAVTGDGRKLAIPAAPSTVVDTVGAGDSFQAALLTHLARAGTLGGRLHTLDPGTLADAVSFAARAAAITCSRPGADPPWAHELPGQDPCATVNPCATINR